MTLDDTFDAARIDRVLRLVDREIWIVTSAHRSQRGGLVATWVMQASLSADLPLVAAAIAENHFTRELIDGSGTFALHLISADQIDHAWRFGLGSGRHGDKLAGVAYETAVTGAPVLSRHLSWLDCRVVHRHDTGDRVYYWADVLAGGQARIDQPPLTEKQLLAAASPDQKRQLVAGLQSDLEVQLPLYRQWRDKIGEPLPER